MINENYEKALQDLKARFGRKRLIVSELVKSILGLRVPDENDSKAIRYLLDTLKNRIRSLESNGLKMKDNESLAMVMLPILETKLPGELREKWDLKVATTFDKDKCKIDIESFFNFLEGHVISKEARNEAEGTRTSGRFYKGKTSKIEERGFSASALLNRTESKPICGFCSKPHDTETCKVALEKSPDERWSMLKSNSIIQTCYDCLKLGSVSHNSRTCKRPKCWDEQLDDDIAKEWSAWKKQLCNLKALEIPCCVLPQEREVHRIELHGFGDASEKAYGAAIYLCAEDKVGKRISNLIMAKSRVAPTRRITLPRLELLAAYLTAKLLNYVLKALKIQVQEIYAWSDSQIVLSWIRNPCSKWKVFVANRVQEIQQKVDPDKWRHCSGDQNPADLLTRGISAKQLANNKLWWNGPSWLLQSVDHWPKRAFFENPVKECLTEARKQSTVSCHVGTTTLCYPDIADKYESWQRLLRVTAWILKWARSRGLEKNGQLSAEEITDAELCWLRIIQKTFFPDEYENLSKGKAIDSTSPILKLDPVFDQEKQLIRVGGRLEFADIPYDAKHQIIIPKKDILIEKLILHLHTKAFHSGPETTLAILRQRFWIIGGRREVKRVLSKCLVCQHWKTKPCQQKMRTSGASIYEYWLGFYGSPVFESEGKRENKSSKQSICMYICM